MELCVNRKSTHRWVNGGYAKVADFNPEDTRRCLCEKDCPRYECEGIKNLKEMKGNSLMLGIKLITPAREILGKFVETIENGKVIKHLMVDKLENIEEYNERVRYADKDGNLIVEDEEDEE